MADFAPPSFSLGLDFDLDSEIPQATTVRQEGTSSKQAQQSSIGDFSDDDFETPIVRPGPPAPDPPRALKRLRRGSTSVPTPVAPDPPSALKRLWRGSTSEPTPAAAQKKRPAPEMSCKVDDEIEAFSSDDDMGSGKLSNEPPSTQYNSMSSSSKFPLHGQGVLTTQSAKKDKQVQESYHSMSSSSKFPLPEQGISTTQSAKKNKQVVEAPASVNMETGSKKLIFPKLTMSPLRRFQLIDSDSDSASDDTTVSEGANEKDLNKVDSSLKQRNSKFGHNVHPSEQRTKASAVMPQSEDLWNDFCLEKSFHIPTPALDEVCDEYFSSMKSKNRGENNSNASYQNSNASLNYEQQLDMGGPLPPSYRYFFHDDQRIQNLVRTRLPNFTPLGPANKEPSASFIDYTGQFCQGEGSKQSSRKSNAGTSSNRKYSRKSNAEEASESPGGWMNPKSCAATPKDAGKRRVQAVGRSAGRWYTDSDGKRVYVTGNGQELTGQTAYRHYRGEDSGARFKRSKKKTGGKKRTGGKNKTGPKKSRSAK